MIHAGEVKTVKILVNPQPPDQPSTTPINLSLATSAALKIQAPTGAIQTVGVIMVHTDPDPNKHFCQRTLTPTDFPLPGAYLVQLIITLTSGDVPESDADTWTIGRSL